MNEYIIEWTGIGARLTELIGECESFPITVKRLRKERLREEILRCRNCTAEYHRAHPYGFCAWAERREKR